MKFNECNQQVKTQAQSLVNNPTVVVADNKRPLRRLLVADIWQPSWFKKSIKTSRGMNAWQDF